MTSFLSIFCDESLWCCNICVCRPLSNVHHLISSVPCTSASVCLSIVWRILIKFQITSYKGVKRWNSQDCCCHHHHLVVDYVWSYESSGNEEPIRPTPSTVSVSKYLEKSGAIMNQSFLDTLPPEIQMVRWCLDEVWEYKRFKPS